MDKLELYGQIISPDSPSLVPKRVYCIAMEHLGIQANESPFYSIYKTYGSVPVAQRKAASDLFSIYLKGAVDYILECLQSFEIYEYDRTRVIAIYKKYATNYINACAEVYAQYCEIRGDQENAKRSREFAKANRGRFVGGGFGIGGAAKGIAMAGAANLATGALYSVGNLLGNAVSKLGADILCDRLFSSKETITFLRNALKNDFLIGTDVLEEILISCNGQAIANPFNNERLLKVKAIMQNIKDNVIPDCQQKKALVETMMNDAAYYDELYLFAYEKFGDDDGNLLRFANFFGKKDIAEKIEKRIIYKREEEAAEKAEREFLESNYEIVQKATEFDGSFSDYNDFYISATVDKSLSGGYTAVIQTLIDEKRIVSPFKEDLVLFETLQESERNDKISTYAEICDASGELTPNEKVLLYINRSVGSNSKKGLLITTKAIYFSPSCKCEVPIIRYDKIDGIVKSSFGQSDIIYEKRAITATAFVGLDDAVSNLLILTVLFFKYGDINITGKITAPPSEAEVAAKTDIAQKEANREELSKKAADISAPIIGIGVTIAGILFWVFVIRKILGLFGI